MTVIEQILSGIKAGRGIYDRVTAEISDDSKALIPHGSYGAEVNVFETSSSEGATSAAAAVSAPSRSALTSALSEPSQSALTSSLSAPYRDLSGSMLALGDNLIFMRDLLRSGYEGRFSTIYIDPPFFTKSKFNAAVTLRDAKGGKHRVHHLAFDDRFDRNLEYYIENMTARLLLMRDLLSDDGLMWVHLDWHSAHYIKLVLDELMGEKNFVNEVIWCYKSGGSGGRSFARKHDTILVYSKTEKYYIDIPLEKSYNRDFKPYRFKNVEEYMDENGWYTLVKMKDVWTLDMVGRTSKERTGYATQKPLALMKRVILAGSREGSLVGDFFCGSGSFAAAAEETGRRWICCDCEKMAIGMANKRLGQAGAKYACFAAVEAETKAETDRPDKKTGLQNRPGYTTGSRESAAGYGRVNLTLDRKDPLQDGRFVYKCRIAEFVPEIDTGYILMADRMFVEEALRTDPLQFADFIVFTDASGASQLYDGDPRDITVIAGDSLGAVLTDVFGREYDIEIL